MRRLLVAATVAVSLLTIRPAPAAEPPGRHVLQESDLRALVALNDPQIAPDGTRVALVVRRPDFVKNT